ncbi:hypothetical protein GH810_04710 [Acetobacterium paludosum]|uniref:LA2681-like HEPN domain-containing protein n=1 Tax=Acetobacterium paludosum TaxID=52693 RepID=A0A923HX65_9FIRM|nr:LA2681 family HEPN domain-containing protein [Acetobacterium paludosum]MBC3887606.1 hypothetical protein [Acetobacterium paludosum]
MEINIRLLKRIDSEKRNKNVGGLKKIISELENVDAENLKNKKKIILYYALECTYSFLSEYNKEDDFYDKRINNFRKSIKVIESLGSYKIDRDMNHQICHIYLKYANILDNCGRSNLAIEYYQKILELDSRNVNAKLDYAVCLCQYTWTMTVVSKNIEAIKYFAAKLFMEAFEMAKFSTIKEGNIKYYTEGYNKLIDKKIRDMKLDEIETRLIQAIILFDHITNNSNAEYVYRKWVSENCLFLHPLNEITTRTKEFSEDLCFDILHFKSMVKLDELNPFYREIFNEMKQTFIYCRLLMYEVITEELVDPHYGDLNTFIFSEDTNIKYSIKMEKLKNVFRLAYSVYDKIAFFINVYFELNMAEKRVSIKSIWKPIREKLNSVSRSPLLHGPSDNRGLNGLYWNSRDVHNINDDNEDPVDLELADADHTRNCLEHRHVSIVNKVLPNSNDQNKIYYISEEELKQKSMRMLKLLREALICLCSAVNLEEDKRKDNYKDNDIVNVSVYKDEWKI